VWRINLGERFAPCSFRPYLINKVVSPQPPYTQSHPLPFQSFCLSLLSPNLCFPISTPPPVKFLLSSLMLPPDLLHCHPHSSMEPWTHSDVLCVRMEGLVKKGLLCPRTMVNEWIVPGGEDVPPPPDGYVVPSSPSTSGGSRLLPTNSSEGSTLLWAGVVASESQQDSTHLGLRCAV